ncbi:DCD domain-containing protein NRP [Corylus avellana]|uniref:DCD domain-containing protein NRP n=1 Tax=Corylus avellana TaxID=13451 RepID=UPI001E1EE8BC|nr:DCD domain-containing protein NRP [Corylus avellana]
MENQQSFWQFSDQLREQTSNLANLSVNDSIWSTNLATKRPEERKNFDIRVGGEVNNSLGNLNTKGSDFNGFNDGWNSLKPKRSDINGINDGWSSLNGKGSDFNGVSDGWSSLKPKGSDFNGINDGWNSFKGKVSDFNGVNDGWNSLKPKVTDFNGFNDGWKMGASSNGNGLPFVGSQKSPGINGGFDKGIYSKPGYHSYNSNIVNVKGYKNGGKGEDGYGGKAGKKNSNANKKNSGENNNDGKDGKSAVDKRFKTLPPSESLPRNETVGGYIFVCNNDTMQENLKRQLFGLPPRYRDSVRAITPGLPLFLYNYSTHQLHGVFEAASFGGTNIDPTAWEDKKCPGESRFPAQVQVVTRKVCEPLEEDSFRPVLHHYDGPKFRLELNIPEALSLLDIFEGQNP